MIRNKRLTCICDTNLFSSYENSVSWPCSHICRWPPGCARAENTPSSSWWGSGSFLPWWWCCSPLWRFASLCPSSRPASSETSVCRPSAAWLPSYASSSVLFWEENKRLDRGKCWRWSRGRGLKPQTELNISVSLTPPAPSPPAFASSPSGHRKNVTALSSAASGRCQLWSPVRTAVPDAFLCNWETDREHHTV